MASVWGELKRRNVVRVAVAYIIAAWLLLQLADIVLNNIEAPDWVFQAILLLVVLGFPIALIFAWAFELTPEGLKKEKDVDRSESITHITGRKLDFAIIGVLSICLRGPDSAFRFCKLFAVRGRFNVPTRSRSVLPSSLPL